MKNMADILYPRRCALCDGILKKYEIYVCKNCSSDIGFIKGRTCAKCGAVLKSRFDMLCADCLNARQLFDEAFAPFAYDGKIRKSIVRFKYYGRAEYAAFYAECIYGFGAERIKRWAAEAVIPVPVHRSRLAKRGYNQSYLIAKELSVITGIPVRNDVVKRKKRTEAQKELTASARRINLMSAFSIVKNRDIPESVIIADDIFTTGSTVNAMAYILRSAGVKRIYVVCVSTS